MPTEIRSDISRLLARQYANGHQAGYAAGVDDGRSLAAAAKRDPIVFVFVLGALFGLLAGMSL
jgi:hypothetical protein